MPAARRCASPVLLTAVIAVLLTPGLASATGTSPAVRLAPVRQADIVASGKVESRVRVPAGVRWTLTVRPFGRRTTLARTRGSGPRTRAWAGLTPTGARLLSTCRARRVVALLRRGGKPTRRHVRRLRLDPTRCTRGGDPRGAPGYRAGAAVRSLAVPDGGPPVYLGGYGIGGGTPFGAGRVAKGTFPDGLEVRTVAIAAGDRAVLMSDAEAQGWFAAVEEGPFGLSDARREIARRSGGLLTPERVVLQANHSHAGPDLMGAWGGVPLAYRKLVYDRTVEAALAALAALTPATLSYGTAPAGDLLVNQFEGDPNNARVDDELRVLEARAADDGHTLVTVLNHNAHPTVLGADNLLASGDWTTSANRELERRTGAPGVTLMGTLGRTQPRRPQCPGVARDLAADECAVRTYATQVVDRAATARERAEPVGTRPLVDGRSFLIQDAATNAPILGLNYVGSVAGAQLSRSKQPPFLTGTILGTTTATLRIGDVLLSAVPGEAYPQIAELVRTLTRGAKGWMTMGLAGDQLGYLIAPREAYPEPIRRSVTNEAGDQISPLDNDNYFFNVSLTMGERVTCSLLRGAGDLLERGSAPRDAYDRCALYADDLLRPGGADVP